VSNPGSPDRANEDAGGFNDDSAFVIDGATGLGDRTYMPGEASDAAWLANLAAGYFSDRLTRDSDARNVVSGFINSAKDAFDAASDEVSMERYAWPSASFVAVSLDDDRLILSGLGDCTVYAKVAGQVDVFSPLAGYASFESDWAAEHIRKAGGLGNAKDLLSNPQTLASLRKARSLQNTPESGVWTLGLVPDAADHLASTTLKLTDTTYCLLCSDGFSALVDAYKHYTPQSLLEAARKMGLDALISELRQIEREIDPDGQRFPRFKQSDDATAILVKIER
ncbi:MAG: hypothetical protein ACR2O0_13915, partial [Rhizobiaceae bacterium]